MKKVIISLFISVLFIFGINDVKAEEGEGNIGTKTVVCKYCSGTDCFYSFQNKNAEILTGTITDDVKLKFQSDPEKTRQRLFHNIYSEPIKFDPKSTLDYDVTYVIIPNPQECAQNLYYIKDIYKEGKNAVARYYVALDDKANLSKYLYYKFDKELENEIVKTYQLVYVYGMDLDITGTTYIEGFIEKTKDIYGDVNNNIGLDITGNEGCAVLTEPIKEKMNWFLNLLKYGGTALAILLGAFDFMKAVLSDEDGATKKAAGKFTKRLIAAALIFLLPLLIQFILSTVEIEGFNVDSPTCNVGMSN